MEQHPNRRTEEMNTGIAARGCTIGICMFAWLCAAADITIENDDFRFVVGDDACVRSLVLKATGEECADLSQKTPVLTVTQDRPFDNELKLIHPHKRTTYSANSVRKDGDLLTFGFEHGLYEASVRVKAAPRYVLFTLEDFPFERKGSYTYLRMDIPRAATCRFLRLPVRERKNFGNWLNACWDERAAVCVAGASPHPDVDHPERRCCMPMRLPEYAFAGLRLRSSPRRDARRFSTRWIRSSAILGFRGASRAAVRRS